MYLCDMNKLTFAKAMLLVAGCNFLVKLLRIYYRSSSLGHTLDYVNVTLHTLVLGGCAYLVYLFTRSR